MSCADFPCPTQSSSCSVRNPRPTRRRPHPVHVGLGISRRRFPLLDACITLPDPGLALLDVGFALSSAGFHLLITCSTQASPYMALPRRLLSHARPMSSTCIVVPGAGIAQHVPAPVKDSPRPHELPCSDLAQASPARRRTSSAWSKTSHAQRRLPMSCAGLALFGAQNSSSPAWDYLFGVHESLFPTQASPSSA